MTADKSESLVSPGSTNNKDIKIVSSSNEDKPIVENKYRAYPLRWIVLALFVLYSG